MLHGWEGLRKLTIMAEGEGEASMSYHGRAGEKKSEWRCAIRFETTRSHENPFTIMRIAKGKSAPDSVTSHPQHMGITI